MHKLDFNHIASKIENNQSLNLPKEEMEWLNAVIENTKTLEHTFDPVKGLQALNLNSPKTKLFKLTNLVCSSIIFNNICCGNHFYFCPK